jgi:DNA-binding LacI/PurR family transcriptional regulator
MIGSLETEGVCTIDVDNRAAARAMVGHLIGLGHRRIACITGSPASCTASADRLAGYREALRSRGIAPDEQLIREGRFTAEPGHRAVVHG